MKHKHYDLIVKWAENPEAWDVEEWSDDSGMWARMFDGQSPVWSPLCRYRLIPRTRTMRLGDLTFPEPLREAPETGTEVWLPNIFGETYAITYFLDEETKRRWLERGLLHSTREAAEAHVKAMLTMVEVKP